MIDFHQWELPSYLSRTEDLKWETTEPKRGRGWNGGKKGGETEGGGEENY